MGRSDMYYGPPRGLYLPHMFLFFMDQEDSGPIRWPVELLAFKHGTALIGTGDINHQIWHIHHYGVTLDYRLEYNNVTISLFGEDIPLRKYGLLSKPPISEVERIIKEEANKPKYAEMEQRWKEECEKNAK